MSLLLFCPTSTNLTLMPAVGVIVYPEAPSSHVRRAKRIVASLFGWQRTVANSFRCLSSGSISSLAKMPVFVGKIIYRSWWVTWESVGGKHAFCYSYFLPYTVCRRCSQSSKKVDVLKKQCGEWLDCKMLALDVTLSLSLSD